MKTIGKVVATEKNPTTIDSFCFWTDKCQKLRPFDVVVVKHLEDSKTYGVIEEISHITDSPSYLTGYISSDFGNVESTSYMDRIGMNCVVARVVGNTKDIYIPVQNGATVSFAEEPEIKEALGLANPKNPLPCGYIEMYDGEHKKTIPVHFNSHFLVGPEGAHLNISGISGLASKTSYAMFLMKAIQEAYSKSEQEESVAFVMLNVKGKDLLAIDELNEDQKELTNEVFPAMEILGMSKEPFQNVKYFYPYAKNIEQLTYARKDHVESQMADKKAFQYKYIYEYDKESINSLFANIDDPQETIESIYNYIVTGQGKFDNVASWGELKGEIAAHTKAGNKEVDKNISVMSWRKFSRLFNKTYDKNVSLFANRCEGSKETRLRDAIININKNDVFVVDVAKLDEEMQGFVFSDVMRAIYDLKLGGEDIERKSKENMPSRIIIFIDELNKYASKEVPKSSIILRQLLDITERGRSLGIVLFSAEQFKSDIHDRVKGNCATHAYGRTNAIEISKKDYQYVPKVYQSMLTRLKQGEYILQNPIFRSLLNIKFPKPIYKQFK